MSASRWSLLYILAVLALAPCAAHGAQPVKTSAPLRIHGDLHLSAAGSGIVFPDGSTQTSVGVTYARTELVSPAGTPARSGAALLAALAALNDASETAPALIRIEPGVYDLGSQPLQMKPWVDIEGSGQSMTLLKGGVDGLESGVVVGASNAELRLLGVENTGPGTYCTAIFNKGCSPRIYRVTARASGGSYNSGIFNGPSAQPEINSAAAEAHGPATQNTGIYSILAQPALADVAAAASGADTNTGIYSFGVTGSLTRVSARASGGNAAYGLYCNQTLGVMAFMDVSASGAATNNYGLYLYNNASPLIQDTRIEVGPGPANFGVYMSSCSSEVSRLLADVSGSGENYGLFITGASAPRMSQVHVQVSGGTANHALCSGAASPQLNSVVAVATGSDSHAVTMTAGGGSLKALHSLFWGDTDAVSNRTAATVQLGSCRLDGGIDGPAACTNCYDGSLNSLDGSCR